MSEDKRVSSRQSRSFYAQPGADSILTHPGTGLFATSLSQAYPSRDESGPSLTVAPAGSEKELLDIIPPGVYPADSVDDALRGFVQRVARDLIEGDAWLEVAFLRQPGRPHNDAPEAFRVHIVDAKTVVRRWGRLTQVPPVSGSHTVATERPVRLDKRNMVRVRLDPRLRRELDRTLDALRASEATMDATMDLVGTIGSSTPVGFDTTRHQRMSDEVVLRASRGVGWIGIPGQTLSSPHRAWRALRFARTRLHIRDAALEGLRAALRRGGDETGRHIDFTLEGVPNVGDVDELVHALRDGTRPLTELHDVRLSSPPR